MTIYQSSSSSVLYGIATALSVVFLNHLTSRINPVLSLLFCVVIATAFFHVINARRLKQAYRQFRSAFIPGCVMNISAGILWVATFVGLSLINAYLFIVIYFVIPSILAFNDQYKANKNPVYLLSIYGLFLVLIVIVTQFVTQSMDETRQLVGVLFALFGGVAAYKYRIQAKQYFDQTACSPSMILCVRSFGIIILSLSLLWFYPSQNIGVHNISGYDFLMMLVAALLSFIIPLYLNQKGIKDAGAQVHSIICAFIPLLTLLVSLIGASSGVISYVYLDIAMGICIAVFLVLPTFFQSGKKRVVA